MGVPAELLGRQVRCPHCKQVVVAPVTAGTPPAAPAPVPVVNAPPQPAPVPVPVAVVPPPAPVAPEPELRAFNIPQKEGADSILSEPDESDDEVFGSQPGVKLQTLPPLDMPPQPPEPANDPAVTDDPFGFGPARTPSTPPAPVPAATQPLITATIFDLPPNLVPPAPAPAPAPVAVTGPVNPFADMETGPTPAVPHKAIPHPQPVPVATKPAPAPRPVTSAPAPPTSGNPFADFEAAPIPVPVPVPVAQPRPTPVAADELPTETPLRKRPRNEDSDTDPDEKPNRTGRARPAASTGGGAKNIVLILLAGYAFVATGLAVYGLFFKSGGGASDTGHPLSTIPDNFGEFDPVSRKKVTQHKFRVDGELPVAQRATLGGKVVIGQIEVQPIRIEKRPLQIRSEGTDQREKKVTTRTAAALVLTLDIKNTSSDLPIFPMDPAFTRRATKTDQPITRLVVGPKTYFGGEIEWPLSNVYKKKSEVQQANDTIPLKPGESREYVVFTEASLDLVRTAETAKDPLQWRVQLRRGLIEYKGKDLPVTAVIGVDFKGSEIRGPE